MAVDVIADIEVRNSALHAAYRPHVPATMAACGGRDLPRGDATQAL